MGGGAVEFALPIHKVGIRIEGIHRTLPRVEHGFYVAQPAEGREGAIEESEKEVVRVAAGAKRVKVGAIVLADRQAGVLKVLLDEGGLEAPRRQSQKTRGAHHLTAPSQHHLVDVLLRLNPHGTQEILEGVQLAVQNPLADLRVNGKGTQRRRDS